MVDFGHAGTCKAHQASFVKASKNVIEFVQDTLHTYETKYELLEKLRKERAAYIEQLIKILKDNNVKLGKQLGKCNNQEINVEILKVINDMPFEIKEQMQMLLIKINNRYERIVAIGQDLELVSNKISHFHVLEEDYDDEVVVDLKKSKNPTKSVKDSITPIKEVKHEEKEIVIEEEPELVEETIVENTSIVDPKEEIEENIDNKEEIIEPKNNIKESLIDEDDLTIEVESDINEASIDTALKEIQEIKSIPEEKPKNHHEINQEEEYRNEAERIISYLDYSDSKDEADEPSGECILFTITEKLTLKEIAKNVYGDEKYWKDLYNYGTNRGKLDRKASEYKVPVETIASLAGYLDNVTLKFPTELVTLEEVIQED